MSEPPDISPFNFCLNWLGICLDVQLQIWDGPWPANLTDPAWEFILKCLNHMQIRFNNLPKSVQQYRFKDTALNIDFGSYTDDRYTGLRLAKKFVESALNFFCTLPSLLIKLPRHAKLSTHSCVSPATVWDASKVVLIYITFVFGVLISCPTRLPAFHESIHPCLTPVCTSKKPDCLPSE